MALIFLPTPPSFWRLSRYIEILIIFPIPNCFNRSASIPKISADAIHTLTYLSAPERAIASVTQKLLRLI